MSMFLTDDEIKGLTGKVHRQAQVKALNFMGIPHRVRPDGKPMVIKSHIEDSGISNRKTKEWAPNLGSIK